VEQHLQRTTNIVDQHADPRPDAPIIASKELTIGPCTYMVNAAPVADAGGEALGAVAVLRDITALKRLEEWHAPSVRWAWSLNAASSVFGSVGALVAAIYLGLMQTLVMGGLFYLAALAVALLVLTITLACARGSKAKGVASNTRRRRLERLN